MEKETVTLVSSIRPHLSRWWPFLLLVVGGASRWMLAGVLPEADSTLASEALGCAWAALVSLVLFPQRSKWSTHPSYVVVKSANLRAMLAGAMLLGGPAVALLTRAREVDSGGLTIALALTPVIVAITSSALGTASEGIAGRLWPGLAAAAGLLLVLAQPALGDVRGDLALVLAPTLTGIGAALLVADEMVADETPREDYVFHALLGGACLFFVTLTETYFVARVRPTVSLLAVTCDGALAFLSIFAIARLGATRWSSQFTWVPLLIVIQGIVLMRPQLTAHWVIGLLLLGLAGFYLLLPPEQPMEPLVSSVSD